MKDILESLKLKTTPVSRSMIVMIWAQALAGLTSVFTMIMCAITYDLSPLLYLIPAVFVDAGAVTTVVLWKRKHENVLNFISDSRVHAAVEWLKSKDVDPIEFIRILKE
ncbi:MAG: hypothetical protein ACI4IW_05440 [Oscillospiraceae bacterium]